MGGAASEAQPGPPIPPPGVRPPYPLSPLFQAARPSWASRRLRDPVFLFRVVSYTYAEWFVRKWEVLERQK